MRPSSLASCMRRMRSLAAITAGAFKPLPIPQWRLLTRPSLGLPACPACDSGSARQIQIWHGPGNVRHGSGERWMSPCRRLVDRCCKAHGCPRPWDRLADGRLLCRCNVTSILQLFLHTHVVSLTSVARATFRWSLCPTLPPPRVSGGNQFYCLINHTYRV